MCVMSSVLITEVVIERSAEATLRIQNLRILVSNRARLMRQILLDKFPRGSYLTHLLEQCLVGDFLYQTFEDALVHLEGRGSAFRT